jgi:hypothetical protein
MPVEEWRKGGVPPFNLINIKHTGESTPASDVALEAVV